MKRGTTIISFVCLTSVVFIRFGSEADAVNRDESQVSLEEQREGRRTHCIGYDAVRVDVVRAKHS